MPRNPKAGRLISVDGHTHRWVEPSPRTLPGIPGLVGYAVECNFGMVPLTHWLMRNGAGRVDWRNTPYWFASQAEADAARDELAREQQGAE